MTLSDEDVKQYLAGRFELVRLEAGEPGADAALARLDAARPFPQTLLLDPEGKEVLRFQGFHRPGAYIEEIKKAEARLAEPRASGAAPGG